MAKTLADMTAEERADCIGMWALIEGINLAVIAEADETNTCVVTYPQWDGDSAVHLNGMVTPRYDLPRAWTPDGEPVDRDSSSNRIARLQSAMKEMVDEIRAYEEYENTMWIRNQKLSTAQDYGLTQEDME